MLLVRLRMLLVTAVRVLYRLVVVAVAAAMLIELLLLMLVLMLVLVMLECMLMRVLLLVLLLVLLDRLVLLLLSVPEVGLLSRTRVERVVRVSRREAARAPHRRSWSCAGGRIERRHDVLVSPYSTGPRRRLRLRHGRERLRRNGVGR
jgi:hypothetical protein